MIVIDLGCATYDRYPEDESVLRLIERFKPRRLYGFDPCAATGAESIGRTLVTVSDCAAWTYNGEVAFHEDDEFPLRSRVLKAGLERVPCFDLVEFVYRHDGKQIVLKMDVEGAEYELLPYLRAHDADLRLELLLVEWHRVEGWEERRARIEEDLRCPVEEW